METHQINIKMKKLHFVPGAPYAVAKLYAYWITVNYREAYNIFAANGILFNHESPIRGETFVTKKIVQSAVKISKGLQDCLYLEISMPQEIGGMQGIM